MKHFNKLLFLLVFLLSGRMLWANPVIIGNSRFTFITNQLVRMEYAQNGHFLDDPTLFAIDRSTECKDVKVEEKSKDHYVLSTPVMRIEYYADGFPFGQTNLHVYFKNGEEAKEKHWYIASRQSKNLLGALTTLDEVDGPVDRQEGLLSRDGWYLINDTGKEVLRDGWVSARDKDHVQDLYLFVYGNDYKSALRSLRVVSGPAPMPRKYVHGIVAGGIIRMMITVSWCVNIKSMISRWTSWFLIWDGILRMLPLVRAMQEPEGGQVIVGTGN